MQKRQMATYGPNIFIYKNYLQKNLLLEYHIQSFQKVALRRKAAASRKHVIVCHKRSGFNLDHMDGRQRGALCCSSLVVPLRLCWNPLQLSQTQMGCRRSPQRMNKPKTFWHNLSGLRGSSVWYADDFKWSVYSTIRRCLQGCSRVLTSHGVTEAGCAGCVW